MGANAAAIAQSARAFITAAEADILLLALYQSPECTWWRKDNIDKPLLLISRYLTRLVGRR